MREMHGPYRELVKSEHFSQAKEFIGVALTRVAGDGPTSPGERVRNPDTRPDGAE
jgi:hypothetical protein